jgi:hypothetical protein
VGNGAAPEGHRLAKGGKPQRLHVPDVLRPILRDWWTRAGSPAAGLVFPKRRPGIDEEAGEAGRKHSSHADAFRRDLARAFGLELRREIETKRSNGRKLKSWRWVPAEREMTARERTLLTETEYTLPVDFHSWRRAFNQALADAGVNAQQAQALAGHSSLAAHERYLRNTQEARTIPLAALPRVTITTSGVSASSVLKLVSGDHENAVGVAGFEPATAGTQTLQQSFPGHKSCCFASLGHGAEPSRNPELPKWWCETQWRNLRALGIGTSDAASGARGRDRRGIELR